VSDEPIHLDAGALIALDRRDRRVWARLRTLEAEQERPHVAAPVLAQVWRSGRQANLARGLRSCRVVPATETLARRAGELCAATGTADAVDAIVVATAETHGAFILTSDVSDISRLAGHARRPVGVIAI
jgi:predicted nucleic acid-binding protein